MNTIVMTEQAKLFTKISELFEIIDGMVMDDRKLREGEWLRFCDLIQQANEIKCVVLANPVYIQEQKRLQNPRCGRVRKEPLSQLERVNHKDYVACSKCDRIIKKWGLPAHQETATCIQTFQSKQSTLIKGKKEHAIFGQHQRFSRFFNIDSAKGFAGINVFINDLSAEHLKALNIDAELIGADKPPLMLWKYLEERRP